MHLATAKKNVYFIANWSQLAGYRMDNGFILPPFQGFHLFIHLILNFQMHHVFVSTEKEQQEAIEHIDEVQNEIDR